MNKTLTLTILLSLFLSSTFFAQAPDFSEEEFKELTLKKTQDLANYIKSIGSKDVKSKPKIAMINSAVNLFSSPKCVVQVSSKNKDKIDNYPIRRYLQRLKVLKYNRVEITWFDIQVVSKFVQAPDGTWDAVVKVFQEFKGYDAEGKMKYKDITTKTIKVKVSVVNRCGKDRLKVLLGDIAVLETR